MFMKLFDWARRLLGHAPAATSVPLDELTLAYDDVSEENLTAVIAARLANLTLGDSSVRVRGEGARAALLSDMMNDLWKRFPSIISQCWGKGGKVLVPLISGGRLCVSAVDQSRVTVNRSVGAEPVAVTLLVESAFIDNHPIYRMMEYELQPDGVQRIRQRVVDANGLPRPLKSVPQWADLQELVEISDTKHLLLGWIRCPRDPRDEPALYGVPITYGASQELRELREHLRWYRREFKLARPMLGMDASLWHDMDDISIQDVRRTVQDDDSPFVPLRYSSLGEAQPWQHFAPEIRQSAFEGRLQSLYRRLERACGLSQGVLTERNSTNYANRDEVRASMYDTFCLVSLMRSGVLEALTRVLEAADILAERFELSPVGARGTCQLEVDWDWSLLESSEQTFQQLCVLHDKGLIRGERLAAWALGCDADEARAEVDAARGESGAARGEVDPARGEVRA